MNTKKGEGHAADTQQTESKADEEGGEDKKAEDEPPREKTEEELEAEKEAAYIGLDEYEKRRGKLDDDVSLSRRKVKNDEKQFACKKMKKKVEDTDMFDFSALKKAAQQPKKKGKKKKGQKITRMHLDQFSPFQSTRNTRLLEGFGRGRGRGRGGYDRYNDRYNDRNNDRYNDRNNEDNGGNLQDNNDPEQNKEQPGLTVDQNATENSSFPTLPTE